MSKETKKCPYCGGNTVVDSRCSVCFRTVNVAGGHTDNGDPLKEFREQEAAAGAEKTEVEKLTHVPDYPTDYYSGVAVIGDGWEEVERERAATKARIKEFRTFDELNYERKDLAEDERKGPRPF